MLLFGLRTVDDLSCSKGDTTDDLHSWRRSHLAVSSGVKPGGGPGIGAIMRVTRGGAVVGFEVGVGAMVELAGTFQVTVL